MALDPDRPTRAVLSDLDCLAGKAKAEIENAHAQNVETLRALLRAGMTDGSIRASDDLVIAQVLIGTIAWVPLSPGWVEGTDTTFRERTIAALADLIVGGEVIDRTWHYQTQVDIARFFLPPAHAFDRQAAHAAKIETLLMRASQLFNRRGIDGVSLDDVAGQVGATKGVLYHYFRNKTDLVVSCMKRAFALYERFADAADAAPDGIGKAFTGTYLNIEAQVSGLSPLIQMVGVEALPAAARRDVTRRARQLQRRFEAFGEQARREGSFRDLDFDAVAQLGAGAFEWLPKWLPDTSLSREHVTREILDLFAHGLKA
jgi:AcrR family transcriptional regulator